MVVFICYQELRNLRRNVEFHVDGMDSNEHNRLARAGIGWGKEGGYDFLQSSS